MYVYLHTKILERAGEMRARRLCLPMMFRAGACLYEFDGARDMAYSAGYDEITEGCARHAASCRQRMRPREFTLCLFFHDGAARDASMRCLVITHDATLFSAPPPYFSPDAADAAYSL